MTFKVKQKKPKKEKIKFLFTIKKRDFDYPAMKKKYGKIKTLYAGQDYIDVYQIK